MLLRQKNDRLPSRRGSCTCGENGPFQAETGKQRGVDQMREGRGAESSQRHLANYLDDKPPHGDARAPRGDCRRRPSTDCEMGGSWFVLSAGALRQWRHEKEGRCNTRKELRKAPYIWFGHRGGAGALVLGSAGKFSRRHILIVSWDPWNQAVVSPVVPVLEFLASRVSIL